MDAEKQLAAIREIVENEVLEGFVRDMLANLRDQPEENREWAAGVREWLIDEIWGDPDVNSQSTGD